MDALLTDFCQLTVLQSDLAEGMTDQAIIELFVRRLPSRRHHGTAHPSLRHHPRGVHMTDMPSHHRSPAKGGTPSDTYLNAPLDGDPMEVQWLDFAIRLQLAAWQLWFEQWGLGVKLAHAITVAEAWPDPMTDRSLWWTMERLPFANE